MEGMIGEVKMFAGTFAPRTWAFCEGQLLAISSNTALFSIVGTTYGGDGRSSFGLPDLRGRCPIGPGAGPGLPIYNLGQRGGQPDVILNATQIPSHTHAAAVELECFAGSGDTKDPTSNFISGDQSGDMIFSETANARMAPSPVTVGNTGGNLSHTNMQPYLAIHYIICLIGIYPSRN